MRANKNLILSDLKELLKANLGENFQELILFGSRASGQSRVDSDFDILIVLKEKVDWQIERQISDLCYEIDLKYNIITDSHVISETEFPTLRAKQPVFANALEKGHRA